MLKKHTIFSTGKKVDTFTVTFNSNGGTAVPPATTIVPGRLVPHPVDPTREGFNFVSWYKEPTLINDWDFSTDTMPAIDITLYAKWVVGQYTISFNTQGGSSIQPITQDFGSEVQEPIAPTRSGYSFAGWFSDSNMNNPYTFTTMPGQNIFVYAKWELNQYTVSFDSQGGGEVSSYTSFFTTSVPEPAQPSKPLYDFFGWYKDQNLTNPWNFTVDTIPAQNITLYAKWVLRGEAVFTTPGTYSWVAPADVTSVSVVAVGGGASGGVYVEDGSTFAFGYGGGGGGLGYRNNISVVPGQSYTVVVGAGGAARVHVGGRGTGSSGNTGAQSYFISTSTVRGNGGSVTNNIAASFLGDGGGNGGIPSRQYIKFDDTTIPAGGAGAGGYGSQGGRGYSFDSQTIGIGLNGAGDGGTTGFSTGQDGEGVLLVGIVPAEFNEAGFPKVGGGGGGRTAISFSSTTATSRAGKNGGVMIVWGKNRLYPNNAFPKYTVTFVNPNLNSIQALEGQKLTEPNETKNSTVFIGWFKEPEHINEWNFSIDIVTSDVTLYGKYQDIRGEQSYTTAGTYTWTAPEGIFKVSVVTIGGGASGSGGAGIVDRPTSNGGGGGGLGWKNNISVVPGQTYSVVVGAGGASVNLSPISSKDGLKGGDSYFINTSTVCGFGGFRDGGTFVGDGGGNGGNSAGSYLLSNGWTASGGGGAGGYTSKGGNGSIITSSSSLAAESSLDGGAGGGAGITGFAGNTIAGGQGGGAGLFGSTTLNSQGGVNGTLGTDGGGYSPGYGGGGKNLSRASTSGYTLNTGAGTRGAVRIVWGQGRAFPSTDVGPTA